MLTGAGQAFCAGADLSEFKDLTATNQPLVERRAQLTMSLHEIFPRLTKPVVTAINGAAMGGGAGLALAGDLALMAEIGEARLSRGEARHRRRDRHAEPRAPGRAQGGVRAGRDRRADRCPARAGARAWSTVSSPTRSLMAEALKLAGELAAVSRPAMATTKQLFYQVTELPFAEALAAGRDANKRMRAFRK